MKINDSFGIPNHSSSFLISEVKIFFFLEEYSFVPVSIKLLNKDK